MPHLTAPKAYITHRCFALVGVLAAAVLASTVRAQSVNDVITVGAGGTNQHCTTATIQDAITLAGQRPGPSVIWVSRNTPDGYGYYLPADALEITNQDLEIVGGLDNCSDTVPEGHTEISGSGGRFDPVFRIRGSGVVRLTNLKITLGDADDGEGGGIDYSGRGSLILTHDLIQYNHDDNGYGGGVRFQANAGDAYLGLVDEVDILFNSAGNGGGIDVSSVSGGRAFVEFGNNVHVQSNTAVYRGGGAAFEQDSSLTMFGQGNSVADNSAAEGGGFYLSPTTTANIAAGTTNVWGLFQNNSARDGGALFAMGATLYLHSRTDYKPVTLARNHASSSGGAIFARGFTTVCIKDANVVGNDAVRDGALHLDNAFLYWNRVCSIPDALPIACTVGRCNIVTQNTSTGIGSGVAGLTPGSHAEFARIYFTRNQSDWILNTDEGAPNGSTVAVYDSVVADNSLNGGFVVGRVPALSGVTMTGNRGMTYVFDNYQYPSDTTPEIDLLVDEPNAVLAYHLTGFVPDRLMFNTRNSRLPWPTTSWLSARPIFEIADPGYGVYVQSALSPGVDAAPARGGSDMSGSPRDFDILGIDHGYGPRDIGAFERIDGASYDRIFRSTFDGSDDES